GERSETWPRFLSPRVLHRDLACVPWPACTQPVRRRESGDVRLTVQAHRKARCLFRSPAEQEDVGSWRQWCSVLEHDRDQRGRRAVDRKIQHQAAAGVGYRADLRGTDVEVEWEIGWVDSDQVGLIGAQSGYERIPPRVRASDELVVAVDVHAGAL